MRLQEDTDGRSHQAITVGVHDHHPRPDSVTINNTSQIISAGADYNLDITLPDSGYRMAQAMLTGPHQPGGGLNWSDGALVFVTLSASEAIGTSVRDPNSISKSYVDTYSKALSTLNLTAKIFDSVTGYASRYIALKDALITGTTLRLTFHNYDGSSRTLWVKGQALVS